MKFIGVDLGGTTIKIGIVESGKLMASSKIIAQSSKSFVPRLDQIKHTVNQLLIDATMDKSELGGIGLAFPSIVDSKQKKIVTRYVKFVDADEIDLVEWANANWGIPLALENDARAALVGEWQYGAGRGQDDLVMITLGTGVGSAALIGGKILKGAHSLGGNVGGHMIINYEGDICNCGLRGCVESEASGWVLPSKFRNHPNIKNSLLAEVTTLNFKSIFELASQGDQVAIEIRDQCLKVWSVGVLNLVHAFDPELVIIGGGVMNSKDQIIPPIQKLLDQDSWLPQGVIRVVSAVHNEHAGILGAAYLAAQEG